MTDTRHSAPTPNVNDPLIGGDAERIAVALGNDAYRVRGGWLISCPVRSFASFCRIVVPHPMVRFVTLIIGSVIGGTR